MPKRALTYESDFSESDQSEEECVEESVDVDNQFYDPQDRDFHGLAALLQGYLDGDTFNCSSLVEAVLKQACVWHDSVAQPQQCFPMTLIGCCCCSLKLAPW